MATEDAIKAARRVMLEATGRVPRTKPPADRAEAALDEQDGGGGPESRSRPSP